MLNFKNESQNLVHVERTKAKVSEPYYNNGFAYTNANMPFIHPDFQRHAREAPYSDGSICPVLFNNEFFFPYPEIRDIFVSNYGRVYNARTGYQLPLSLTPENYYAVRIDSKSYFAHVLMAKTFIVCSPFYGLMVNHIDGNKSNNRIDNLEWCSNERNISHAGYNKMINNNWNNIGDAGRNWFSEETKHKICKMLEDGMTVKEIMEAVGGDDNNRRFTKLISKVRNGDRWAEISCQYKFPKRQLSKNDVREICKGLEEGLTASQIADRIGIAYNNSFATAISSIRRRKTFTEISKDYNFKRSLNSKDDIIEICDLIEAGYDSEQIAKELGVPFDFEFKYLYDRLRNGIVWKDITKRYNYVVYPENIRRLNI